MKTFKLNPEAENFDFHITIMNPEILDSIGWDFDKEISNEDGFEDMGYEQAKEQLFANNVIYLRVQGEKNELCTTYEWNSEENHCSRIANGISEFTGDNERTIQDILDLLSVGKIELSDIVNNDTHNGDIYVDPIICESGLENE